MNDPRIQTSHPHPDLKIVEQPTYELRSVSNSIHSALGRPKYNSTGNLFYQQPAFQQQQQPFGIANVQSSTVLPTKPLIAKGHHQVPVNRIQVVQKLNDFTDKKFNLENSRQPYGVFKEGTELGQT